MRRNVELNALEYNIILRSREMCKIFFAKRLIIFNMQTKSLAHINSDSCSNLNAFQI